MSSTPFTNEEEAITYVFESIAQSGWRTRGLDEDTRDTSPTEDLLTTLGLLDTKREYAVVTGSKGKGSVTAITTRLLRSLGHKVGMITSPHLSTYRQRFRINGRMISEANLVRLVNQLKPAVDKVRANLNANQYISPQGIFLALALMWFDENRVDAAVIEVGRGGRFDDNALVPNMLSMFTPIMLEHTRYLGPTVERIAWHKAGIIKPRSYAYSLPQERTVLEILQAEADQQDAQFSWLAAMDIGHYIEPTADGMLVDFGRYGRVDFPMLGRYEIDNASLAIWGAGNMHSRLQSEVSHGSQGYIDRVRHGLENVIWPGRCHKLQDSPKVYVDGAINPASAQSYIGSVRPYLTEPVISVLAVPIDRDYDGVYKLFAEVSDEMVMTSTSRNITINFPDEATAKAAAGQYHGRVSYASDIPQAIQMATRKAGTDGTVLLSLAQPAIGDVMAHYGLLFEAI